MVKEAGFKIYDRKNAKKIPVQDRIKNHKEFYIPQSEEDIKAQASRCMDCGVAYCNNSCPLGNILPDLNYLVFHGQWKKALDILQSTNNFPEFTGRLCPALCEASCTLGINQEATTNREIELSIIEKGFKEGWVKALPPKIRTEQRIAVIGSGPTGLAAAQELNRYGHDVTVFERAENIGGVLALGIPDYKLEKWVLHRRIEQLKEEGIKFRVNTNVGKDISAHEIKSKFDAVCLAGGATVPRNLDVKGRELKGIHFAMDFLVQQNLINQGKEISPENRIDTFEKNVVIIGGGDTGADCLGIALRQGAKNVYQLELMPKPPKKRTEKMPWPTWPMILRTNTSHEEGGVREWSIATKYFSGENGRVKNIHCVKLNWIEDDKGRRMEEIEGSEFSIDADIILFAMGFLHPEHGDMLENFGVDVDQRGNVETNERYMTSASGVFAAGDMRTGQSLVCKAIAEGRMVAVAIDRYLKNN